MLLRLRRTREDLYPEDIQLESQEDDNVPIIESGIVVDETRYVYIPEGVFLVKLITQFGSSCPEYFLVFD